MRRDFPDGSVWVRTHPVTYLHHRRDVGQRHDWHQLTYALRGHLEVETDEARVLVPPACAVWVPAGLEHAESMWAPVAVRTLYIAPGALVGWPRPRTVRIGPLLHALIVHTSALGALDRREPAHAHLIEVILDQVRAAPDAALQLLTPRDPRARRLAERLRADPGDRSSIAELAPGVGASVRTLERLFRAETGLGVGAWRRRLRLYHAMHLLASGLTVGEVADAVGYASPSAFTAAFTQQLGMPPTRYRG